MKMTLALVVLLCACAVSLGFSPLPLSRAGARSLSMIAEGRRPLMGGNWKLNPKTAVDATTLATEVAKLTKGNNKVDIVVFPPHPFLTAVFTKTEATNVQLGGQDCFFEDSGAYTGSVSTCMLKDVGCKYVLCGHSERRTLFADDDGAISRKVKKVLREGLKAVLCIGETKVCAVQLLKDLNGVTEEDMKNVILAYEPVWAIGTGLVCPAEKAQEVHKFIRSVIERKYGAKVASETIIQYGGSVKPDNVVEIMAMPDIDGCLVGGASLTADSFAKIANYIK